MFNKHPKGLIAASFANLGERFGFYTMMAILVLFLQAKFGLDGKEDTIYSSTSVGGEKETTAGKGLNEATNSLDKFFYLKTLEPGEGGSVKLLVGLDGESQGNIYQDTLAKLMMNFAVEDNSNPTSQNPPTFTTTTSKVKTGDIWSIASAVVFVIGIILMILAFVSDRKGAKQNEKIA
jgi:hypothetical protein